MKKVFLRAGWRNLVMANYVVPPALLAPYLPGGTELDQWQGNTYVSLVGFMFIDTRVLGIKIPFHVDFEEVNLRFYVKYNDNGEWKRGVVFISEIVPKPAVSIVANTLFNERYRTCRMYHTIQQTEDLLKVEYGWRYRGKRFRLAVEAGASPVPMDAGSEETFITEHYWGYSNSGSGRTTEHAVEHPVWNIHPVKSYVVDCDFAHLYGKTFAMLNDLQPASVLLAEGSVVAVGGKRVWRYGAGQ